MSIDNYIQNHPDERGQLNSARQAYKVDILVNTRCKNYSAKTIIAVSNLLWSSC